jgi:hypothetical protein
MEATVCPRFKARFRACGFLLLLLPVFIQAAPIERDVAERLRGDGWTRNAAKAVAALNHALYAMWQDEAPGKYHRTLTLLGHLGGYPDALYLLENHPQFAGLLARAHHPDRLAQALYDSGCLTTLENTLVSLADPASTARLTPVLETHGHRLCRLLEADYPGVLNVLTRPVGHEPVTAYQDWLGDAFDTLLTRDEAVIADFLTFLERNQHVLRERMDEDPTFADRFANESWPGLLRVAADSSRHPFRDHFHLIANCSGTEQGDDGDYYDVAYLEPSMCRHTWDLLATPDGRTLLADVDGGMDLINVVDALYGSHLWNRDPAFRRQVIVPTLKAKDEETLAGIVRFGENARFRALLGREQSPYFRQRIVRYLDAQCTSSTRCPRLDDHVATLAGMSHGSLRDELYEFSNPPSGFHTWLPGYGIVRAAGKTLSGRPLNTSDYVLLGLDAVSFIGATRALKVFQRGAKVGQGGHSVNKPTSGIRRGTSASSKIQRASDSRDLGRRPGTYFEYARQTAQKGIDQVTGRINITPWVQATFKKSGLGRATIKKLTGLDARVFMRKDRQVVVDASQSTNRLLQETAANALVDVAGESAGTAVEVGVRYARPAYESFSAIQKNHAYWWLELAAQP